jgi:1-acyl-sn-glycerol-3-phosphate acyltransferase
VDESVESITHPAGHRRHAPDAKHAGPHPDELRPIIRALMALNRQICSCVHRVRVLAPCRLPAAGPAILVSNHISHMDPALIQSGCRQRQLSWMMTRDFYDLPLAGPLFRMVRAIPVSTSGRDVSALRAAMRGLEEGRIIGIFPEGRIGRSGQMLEFQTGVALIAMRSGVPVFPAALSTAARVTSFWEATLQPQEVQLAFGDPVHLGSDTSREAVQAATDDLRRRISGLLESLTPAGSGLPRASAG